MHPAAGQRPAFLSGGGELADLIAHHPWQSTALGPMEGWPSHVRHTVALMLRSDVPMVALFGEPGTMVYNDAYSVVAGGRHPQLLGSPVREGWPEVADFNDNVMRVGLAGGTLSYKDQELTLYRRGAPEQVWMNLDYSPVLDDAGRPAAVLAIVVETTDKVRALRRLAGERTRLAQMFEQAPAFSCTLHGPEHVFEFANAAYRQLFRRDLIGKRAREAFPELEGQGFFERLDEVYATGKPYRAEAMPARLLLEDGRREDKSLTFIYQPLFDDSGAVTGIFCEGMDVTATMQAYAELQRTQSWLQDGVQAARMVAFEWDMRSGHVSYSANAREVIGYGDGDAEIGFSTIHPEDEPRLREAIRQARERNGSYQLVHRRIRPDTGAVIWTDTRGRVDDDAPGTQVMRGVVIDVTERVRSEQALREANRRKDEFLAMLAHELRNPLAPIATGSALLSRAADNADVVRRTSALIDRQVRHMSELVDDLLDVSRVTRGLIEITHEPVVLQGVVQAALEQARPLVEARRHHVVLDLPPGEIVVDGDRTRLVQVLVNLVANAAKYTPPGGSIRVLLSAAGSRARIDVVDDGVGIDAALLPHIFELFTQGARTPDRSQGGLGIGLALVKALVDLHQGEVAATSDGKGRGSRFSVLLPLAAQRPAAPAATASPAAASASHLRILVTDDNVDAADSLAALLRSEGHAVVVAYSGGEALAAIDRGVPDVCILDLGLPDITGVDLARELRGRPALAGTLLVALTGYGQPQDRQATRDAGFDAHLVKPMRPSELEDLLAQHARERRRA